MSSPREVIQAPRCAIGRSRRCCFTWPAAFRLRGTWSIGRQVKAVQPAQHRHVERDSCRTLFAVAVRVEIVVVVALVGESVNQPRVPVGGEDHRLVFREDGVELRVRPARAGAQTRTGAP